MASDGGTTACEVSVSDDVDGSTSPKECSDLCVRIEMVERYTFEAEFLQKFLGEFGFINCVNVM